MSVFFDGRLLVTPTVASAIYDQGLAPAFPGRAPNIPIIMGTSLGGVPKTPIFFDSPVQARRVLRDGELLRGVEAAFNPAAEVGSPSRVGAIRVEDAVQSQLMLKDASSNNVILLKSADYGAHTNGIKVTVAAGTTTGKRLTVQHDDSYFTRDNVARTPLTVRYGGAAATATVTVTASTLVLHAPAATAVATLTLNDYRSVRALCDAINAVSGFSAIALQPTKSVRGTLDGLTATSCKDTDLAVTANLQAVIDWFNQTAGSLVSATRQTNALAVPANLSATFLAGGSNGSAPSNNDWQDAFDALQGADVQYVVPMIASESVWEMADAHCQYMSTAGKSERRAFVGDDVVEGTLALAITDIAAKAMALNSDRTALCFPPILAYDEDDQLTPMPAYYLAAKLAGGFGAINPGETMTNKALAIDGIDPVVATVYDTDALIEAGVLCVKKDRRGFVVAKAVPTWLSNDNYNRVEISTGIALDYVARTVREALDTFIGRKASPITLHEALSTTESTLRELARPEPVGIGVIVGDAANPAYRNITAEIQGDILRVWFECNPAIPINYVLIGVYARAYSGTATAAVANG